MTLYEIATQLCRLKECSDFPLKYKTDVERLIHALNVMATRYYYDKHFECPVCNTKYFRVDMEDIEDVDEEAADE